MHSVIWFAAVLVAANLYGLRLSRRIGYVAAPLLPWQSAFIIALAVVGASLATAYGYLGVPHDAGVGLYAIVAFVTSWLGLRYWSARRSWDLVSGGLAFGLVIACFAFPERLAGPVLVTTALGISIGGYYATKTWLRVLFSILCAFDVYAVWLSDTMEMLMRKQPGLAGNPFAMILFHQLEIGTMDVFLAAVAIIGIQRHRGATRAVVFSGLCLAAVFVLGVLAVEHPKPFARVPYVVVLAPLVWLGLAGGKKTKRAKK